jgi:DNA integrity scanning protein DisA with diadenylate cyclase activity
MIRKCVWLAVAGLLCVACGDSIDSHDDAMEARLDMLEELNKIINDVKDKASAEDAVAEIKELGERAKKMAEQIKKLPEPGEDEMEKLMKKYGERAEKLTAEVYNHMPKLTQFPELAKALEDVMKGMG